MKRMMAVVALLIFLIAAGNLFYFITSSYEPVPVNGSGIMAAVNRYVQDLNAQGVPVPDTVALQQLIERGYLAKSDAGVLAWLEVTIHLSTNRHRPQDVLLRARLPNGDEIVALGDGSIQQGGN